ncbi:MAG: hypothetical protein NTW02_11320, partial [Cyanobium sp. LacPavin_0920_WC12_MAG_62_9]|nr:hypothetical protein [Cyanobium sp. LacPavin_0920_WC12_MAG_62_9]
VATLGALVRVLPILAISTMPFIAGKVDRYFSICFANPWSALQVYVSSYCFAVNQAGLECLLQLPVLAQDDFQYQPFALPIAPGTNHVMARFRAFVSLHVNSQSPYAWHHAQSRGLSEQLLRRKARCIYYEHRLSGEIGLVGAIVPINDKLSLRLSLFVRDYLVRVYFRVQSLALIAFLSAVRRLSNLFKS